LVREALKQEDWGVGLREYTKIITIKVIASVMADSEDEAEVSCCGVQSLGDTPHEVYGPLPELLHPQIIGATAFNPMRVSSDLFKARSFKEAVREIDPDVEEECEGRPVVFPPRYSDLPEIGSPMDKAASLLEGSVPLVRIAQVCRDAAISEMEETVSATGRFATFEIQESAVSPAVRNSLAAFSRRTFNRPFRICREYGVNAVANVDGIAAVAKRIYGRTNHPIDVAVLYPTEVVDYAGPHGYAWAEKNCAAVGLIEIKTQSGPRVQSDLEFLSEVAALPKANARALKWVIFLLVVHGTELQVKSVQPAIHSLDLLTSSGPRSIPTGPGSERVMERWYDVRCYGRLTELL
jgi:hypothetical protein